METSALSAIPVILPQMVRQTRCQLAWDENSRCPTPAGLDWASFGFQGFATPFRQRPGNRHFLLYPGRLADLRKSLESAN
jgi:hypothetical protein